MWNLKYAFLLTVLLGTVFGDDWIMESNELPVASDIPTLSNGHLGFVVYGDAILMNGLYNGVRGTSHRARIPNYSNLIAVETCVTDNCLYRMNMKQGYFEKIINNGRNYRVLQHMYPHRFYNRAIINRMIIERLESTAPIEVSLSMLPGDIPGNDTIQIDSYVIPLSSASFEKRDITVRCFQTNDIEDTFYQPEVRKFCLAHTNYPAIIRMEANERTAEYYHITAVGDSEGSVIKEIIDVLIALKAETLFESHTSAWENDWNSFGISVGGNDNLNKIIHASIFYLISNLPSAKTNQINGQFYGLSPSGIGKGGILYAEYQGHSFWDTEMWMLPPMTLLNPKWSEDILSYRYMTRKAASDNAKATNYNGYRYPWESAYTGREVTPDCCPEVVEYQHHVISDIAYAFRSHLAATHDMNWWKNVGCDIAYNTAKFWQSRANFNKTSDYYEIRNVMGPDEDHHNISNNVYTNVNAAINLYFGDFALCACQFEDSSQSEEEQKDFVKIARSLKLLYNETADFHPEYEEYEIGEPIKQADVVLLGFPLQFPMDPKTKRNNLLTYEKVTRENGPAMTWAMHTIGFLDLNDEKEAAINFERSFNIYTREPFKVWSEVIPGTVGAGNFITGAGGFLQSIINGYGGVRLHFDHLIITNFYLPPKTTTLDFAGITYLNNRFSMKITGEDATINFIDLDPTHPLEIMIGSKIIEVLKSTTINFKRSDELIMKPKINPFGTCVMKETVTGLKAGVSRISLNSYIVIILASIAVIANFIGIL